jgi:hypothetical protein
MNMGIYDRSGITEKMKTEILIKLTLFASLLTLANASFGVPGLSVMAALIAAVIS